MNKISDKAKRGLEWLGIRVTGSRWAWTAAIGTLALWASTTHGPQKSDPPIPNPAVPQIDLQRTVDTRLPAVISRAIYTSLPPPIENQYKPPCDRSLEFEINGGCWVAIITRDGKCPKDKAYSHDGKCWQRAMRSGYRPPTSGDVGGPGGVAAPE